ncbi:hypothetical protein MUY22_29915 [Amycolatopsis sp. WQ 127309]|nr:hypothetical protein [Amycolatopsis sp. WQ 127309]UOZ03065.1 hypothetical protein MUY22_29915 [Amycolatopsis sp. WQ 127309]
MTTADGSTGTCELPPPPVIGASLRGCPEHRDRRRRRGVQREDAALVLHQDGARRRDVAGRGDVLGGGGRRGRRSGGGVEEAVGELLGQQPGDLVVEHGHADRSGADGVGQGLPEVARGGHGQVEFGVRRLHGAAGAVPVGDDEAVEAPVLLGRVLEQGGVFVGVHAVHETGGGHDGRRVALLHRLLERRVVDLVEGALVDDRVGVVAVLLGVVGHQVLEVGHHVVGLHALDVLRRHRAGQVGVLARHLEDAPAARVAHEVDVGPEVDADALRLGLGADDLAVGQFGGRVPARRGGHRGRQRRRPAHDHAGTAVVQVQRGHAQPGDRGHHTGVPGELGAVRHRQLLVGGHLRQHLCGPLGRRGCGSEPRAGRLG